MEKLILKADFDPVNGQRVRLARELRGLTQISLAELLNVDQTMVAHIERGTKQPGEDVLESLASELQFPEEFFRQPDPPYFPAGSLLFRSKSGVGKKFVAQAHAHATIAFEFALRLSQQASLIPVRLPQGENPDAAAQRVRKAMGIADGPISNLTREIERLGVLVFPLPDLKDCDAFAVWAGRSREYPVIGIIGSRPTDRRRMSIAHELGHLVLHRSISFGTQQLETHAYRFAAELLMPRDEILDHFTAEKLNLFRLAALKGIWGVSMQALARRARELAVINDRQYRYLMKQLSMKGWRTVEPNLTPLQTENPRAIRKLVEVVLGHSPNLKLIAHQFALPGAFLQILLSACAPPPKRNASRSPRQNGDIIAFTRNNPSRL